MNTKFIIVFSLLISISGYIKSQINVNPQNGCIGQQFQFDYTGGSTFTSPHWDFDDGGSGADILQATHTYSSAGTYHVVFTANNGGTPINEFIDIIVHPNPNPNFEATTITHGCIPLNVAFNDLSTGGGGSTITNWSWAFGDGGVGYTENPTHNFSLSGLFDVTLTTTDANGCVASFVLEDLISTSPLPNPVITTNPSPAFACTAPLNVTFSGSNSQSNSPTGTSLIYSWDFANGNTSTLVNPPIQTYSSLGNYIAQLTVTDNNGCSNTSSVDVSINNPTAGFVVNDTVCKSVSLQDTSTGNTTFWHYGDGSMGYSSYHTYADTGNYEIMQIVYIGSCRDTAYANIYVEEPIAEFSIDPTFLCSVYSPNNIIHYINESSENATSFIWDFGLSTIGNSPITGHYHGTLGTSTLENPTDTIIFVDTTYSINAFSVFNTCLKIRTSHGCISEEVCHKDTIQKPNALFMTNKIDGCLPLTVEFSDSSSSFIKITNFEWFFGDGTSFLGGELDTIVNHTYNNEGIYQSYLVITNEHGCKDTSYFTPIYVGDVSNPNFTINQTTVCPTDTVLFANLTTISDSIDYYHFTAENSLMSHCPSESEPFWVFNSVTGPQNITLTACNNGCCTDKLITNAITVKGPIGKISNYTMDCSTPYDYTFYANLQETNSWDWNFGDGTISSNLTNLSDTIISHTYTSTGNYNVILTSYNSTSGCLPYSDTIKIYVRDVKASLEIDTLLCADNNEWFNSANSIDIYKSCNRGYYWDFGDGTPPIRTDIDSIYHNYPDTGTYEVTLIVRDINLCTDTTKGNYYVYDVYPGFTIDHKYGCKPSFTVNFTDTSNWDYGNALESWQWNYNGYINFSNSQNPTFDFNYTQQYVPISLTITDTLGCSKTAYDFIAFSLPSADFDSIPSINVCIGDSVGFITTTANLYSDYNWNFGDGDTLFSQNGTSFYHTYNNHGYFNVSLEVIDSIGCSSTHSMLGNVSVQTYPEVGFFTNPDINLPICFGNMVTFIDTSNSIYSSQRNWLLDGNTPITADTSVGWIYVNKGIFPISLTHTTTNGCSTTILDTVNVVGPEANLDLFPNHICKGEEINFTVSNMQDVYYYYFDFGDGTNSPIENVFGQTSTNQSHTYNYSPISGQTTAQLFIFSDNMMCQTIIDTTVFIYPVISDFNRNNEIATIDTAHCLHIADQFFNTSINGSTWQWNFGDGNTSSLNDPQHTYQQAGIYNVTLSIHHDISGCTDTLIKQMIIYPKPDILANGGNICLGDTLQILTNNLIGLYQWEPSTNLNSPTSGNPYAFPTESTNYTVYFNDNNNCKDTAEANIFVQQPPIEWVRDTTIIIGESFNLNGEQQGGFTYVWSPETNLNCTICPNPNANPQNDITYYLTIQDTMGCNFITQNQYDVIVLPVSSVDVPSAFTPNGDGSNDIIYVRGWGIKKLLEFSIYNRWGELMFTTNDINVGWDGTFNGKPQNIDTYAYYVRVETYIDVAPLSKKGNFTLLR